MVGSSLLIGISMILYAIIVFLEPANSTGFGFEGLVGILDGIFGVVLIIAGSFCIYQGQKKVLIKTGDISLSLFLCQHLN